MLNPTLSQKLKKTRAGFCERMVHPGVPKSSEETPTDGLRGGNDVLDFANKCVQHAHHRPAFNDINFPKRYIEGNLNLILRFNSRSSGQIYQLLFVDVPSSGRNVGGTMDDGFSHADEASSHSERCDDAMLGPFAEFIQCPEQVVPSPVWFEPFKEPVNLLREVFTSTVEATFEVGGSRTEREVNLIGSDLGSDRSGVSCQIKSGSEVLKRGQDSIAQTVGERPCELDLVKLIDALVVHLGDGGVRAGVEESARSSFELREVFLSPVNAKPRIPKLVPHK